MQAMILVVGTVRVPEDAFDSARAAMVRVIAETRKEDGCIRYAYARDLLDPGVMHISEAWRDRDALKAHFTAPHMRAWRDAAAEIGMSERDLRIYEADEGEAV